MDKAKHIPQGYTQRLLDLGVIEFSETIYPCGYICECYEVQDNFVMMCGNLDISSDCIYMEKYNEKGEFEVFRAGVWDDNDDFDIIPNDIEVYKKIRI